MREEGEQILQYLKRGATEKRGGETKTLKRGLGQAGSSGGSVSVQVTPFFMVSMLCAASKFNISQLPRKGAKLISGVKLIETNNRTF